MVNKPTSVIVVWNNNNNHRLESNLPLAWNGRHNRQIGSENDITLVLLTPKAKLPTSYLDDLKDLNYKLIDASLIFAQLSKQYSYLDRFGDYEKKCFLRWLVLEQLFPQGNIIHYDGDIIWNIPPEQIAAEFVGKTLVLDGCPAFVSIASPTWFAIYRRMLDKLVQDVSFGHDWEGTSFRSKIGSDQDLISYLLSKNLLPQDSLPQTSHVYVENPLISKIPYKQMAFWHMQTDFIHYLNLKYMLAPYGLTSLAPNPLLANPLVLKGIYLLGRLVGRGYQPRLKIYQYFLDKL